MVRKGGGCGSGFLVRLLFAFALTWSLFVLMHVLNDTGIGGNVADERAQKNLTPLLLLPLSAQSHTNTDTNTSQKAHLWPQQNDSEVIELPINRKPYAFNEKDSSTRDASGTGTTSPSWPNSSCDQSTKFHRLYDKRLHATSVMPTRVPPSGVIWKKSPENWTFYTVYFPSTSAWKEEAYWIDDLGPLHSVHESYITVRSKHDNFQSPAFGEYWLGSYTDSIVARDGNALVQGVVNNNNNNNNNNNTLLYLPRYNPTRNALAARNVFEYASTKHFMVQPTCTVQYVPGQLLNEDQMFGQGYYHFLIEGFAKVAAMLPHVDMNRSITINTKDKPFKRDAYQLLLSSLPLGQQGKRVAFVTCTNSRPCVPDTLFTSNGIRQSPTPYHVRTIRSALFKAVWGSKTNTNNNNVDDPPRSTRPKINGSNLIRGQGLVLLIIRRQAPRHVINHDDVVAALQSRWPLATISEFSRPPGIKATVELFAKAHIAIGPHGAGNQNCLFLHKDTPFIPINHPDYPFWFSNYIAVAGMRVWPYGKTTTHSGNKTTRNKKTNKFISYEITDIPHFVNRVETALRQRYDNDDEY